MDTRSRLMDYETGERRGDTAPMGSLVTLSSGRRIRSRFRWYVDANLPGWRRFGTPRTTSVDLLEPAGLYFFVVPCRP